MGWGRAGGIEVGRMEEQPQAKRRRRPSVRLGEIGFAAPYDASSLWIEAPRQRRKSAPVEVLSTGKPAGHGAKAPRIRPLEQLARAETTAVVEEEWAVIEPTVDEHKFVVDGKGLQGKPARRAFTRKVNTKVRGKGPGGGRSPWTSNGKEEATRTEPPPDVDVDSPETRDDEEEDDEDDDDEEEKELLPSQAVDEAPILSISSESEELLGSDLKGEEELPADDSGNGASDGSEEGEPGAKPNSHGAIEDGPDQANGKVFRTIKPRPGERRSGRQAASRVTASRDLASRDIASRDTAIRDSGDRDASRDIAGEPSGRFQTPAAAANGTTTMITPNSSQRGLLSAGVSGWLQDLGLGKYSELFELNEVDTEVLPLLTFEDLREMGVDAVGARRKMFTAIQELGHIRGI